MWLNRLLSLLVLAMGGQGIVNASQSPTGEIAHYIVDSNPERTSSFIKSGAFDTRVGQFLSESIPPSYEVTLNYFFKIKFIGEQEGIQTTKIDAAYFGETFMSDLRHNGHYETQSFKIDHLGYSDKTNLDGKFYPHCDKIKIYDIQSGPFVWFARGAFSQDGSTIENLVIVAHIFESIPVLGGAQIDMSGVYNGMDVKAGGDYITP